MALKLDGVFKRRFDLRSTLLPKSVDFQVALDRLRFTDAGFSKEDAVGRADMNWPGSAGVIAVVCHAYTVSGKADLRGHQQSS